MTGRRPRHPPVTVYRPRRQGKARSCRPFDATREIRTPTTVKVTRPSTSPAVCTLGPYHGDLHTSFATADDLGVAHMTFVVMVLSQRSARRRLRGRPQVDSGSAVWPRTALPRTWRVRRGGRGEPIGLAAS